MEGFSFSDKFKTEHQDVYNRIYPNGVINKFAVIKEAQSLKIQIGTMKVVDMAKEIQRKLIGDIIPSANSTHTTPTTSISNMDVDPYKIVPFTQSVVENTQLFKVYIHLLNLKSKVDNKNSRDANIYLENMSIYILGDFDNGVLTGVTDTSVQHYVGFKEMMKWREILNKGISNQITTNDYDTISNEIQYILARMSREFANTSKC